MTDPTTQTEASTNARVLVVDDELALSRAYARVLEQAGHDVVVATDGVKAMELVESGAFDVIVSDVFMPGLNGLDLLHALRRRRDGVQIILMTAAPTDEGADAAAMTGALMYLVKPLEFRVLVQVVDHAWRLRRRNLDLRSRAPGPI